MALLIYVIIIYNDIEGVFFMLGIAVFDDEKIIVDYVGELIKRNNEEISIIKHDIYTQLQIKTEEAKKYDINIELKIDYFIELNMEDIDVCNIFTNLLDNSIEAAKKNENKNVKLYIRKMDM